MTKNENFSLFPSDLCTEFSSTKLKHSSYQYVKQSPEIDINLFVRLSPPRSTIPPATCNAFLIYFMMACLLFSVSGNMRIYVSNFMM